VVRLAGEISDYEVVNLGISGETVEGLLARRESIRSQIDGHEYVFLMTGINNIANEQYGITEHLSPKTAVSGLYRSPTERISH